MPTGLQNTQAQLQGTRLFIRAMELTIGFPNDPTLNVKTKLNAANSSGLDVSGLDAEFTVDKSLKITDPCNCEIKVYNLSPTSREKISGDHPLTVRLEAGYQGGVSQLYFAEVRAAWTERQGPNFVTHIESTDTVARPTGIRRTKKPQPGSATGNITRTMGPKVPLQQAFQAISDALGIGQGNLQQALANVHGAPLSVNGSALVGNAARRMTDLCRSAGLEWSVQDGNLQLINIAQILGTSQAILISQSTGLVNSPAVDSQGTLEFTTLIIPGLQPGALVSMDTEFVKGGYRIEKVRYVGSTFAKDWYCHVGAVRY